MLYLKKYGHEPSELELARMWNGGIYTGYTNSATTKYAAKYYKYYMQHYYKVIYEKKNKNKRTVGIVILKDPKPAVLNIIEKEFLKPVRFYKNSILLKGERFYVLFYTRDSDVYHVSPNVKAIRVYDIRVVTEKIPA